MAQPEALRILRDLQSKPENKVGRFGPSQVIAWPARERFRAGQLNGH
jgi:hypothetical protein